MVDIGVIAPLADSANPEAPKPGDRAIAQIKAMLARDAGFHGQADKWVEEALATTTDPLALIRIAKTFTGIVNSDQPVPGVKHHGKHDPGDPDSSDQSTDTITIHYVAEPQPIQIAPPPKHPMRFLHNMENFFSHSDTSHKPNGTLVAAQDGLPPKSNKNSQTISV